MVLAAEAEPDGGTGDPLELGLHAYAESHGTGPITIRMKYPRQSVHSFDSAWRYMRVSVTEDGGVVAYLKGAAEVLLEHSNLADAERADWQHRSRGHPRLDDHRRPSRDRSSHRSQARNPG